MSKPKVKSLPVREIVAYHVAGDVAMHLILSEPFKRAILLDDSAKLKKGEPRGWIDSDSDKIQVPRHPLFATPELRAAVDREIMLSLAGEFAGDTTKGGVLGELKSWASVEG